MKKISLVIMALFYIFAGANHFRDPDFYMRIMPPYLPWHLVLVYISGAAELILGAALLVPKLRQWAAWGIVLLLFAVYPANIYQYQVGGAGFDVPHWVLIVRLFLQLPLIAWAYYHTRPDPDILGPAREL